MDETEPADTLDPMGPRPMRGDQGALVVAQIGRYPVLRKLGEGGMGVVYAAYDEQLNRKLAIKLLHPRRGKVRDDSRLLREAQGLARLSHANVVQIYEIGEHQDAVFIVMEFVAGQTLGEWLEEKPRSREQILQAFTAAGRGLAAAHAAHLIHRDFKPDNVMISAAGGVKVMDFGLVRTDGASEPAGAEEPEGHKTGDDLEESLSASQHDTLGTDLTKTGSVMGTPAYMAPEQHLGASTDARSDQFSFCVAMWEALYGVRPFPGESVASLTFNVLRGELSEPPREADVPGWLRKVIERGLSLAPEDRWPSLEALLSALTRDPTRRRRRILALLTALAVIAGGWSWKRASEVRAIEAHRLARVQATQACEDEGQRGMETTWNDALREQAERAFAATGLTFAADAWTRTRRLMDDYAQRWTRTRALVCVEAEVERSRDRASLDLAITCLDERRASLGSLAALLAEADEARVMRAVSSSAKLPLLDDCTNEAKLGQLQPLPDDPEQRAQVEALRRRLSRVGALLTMGEYEVGADEAGELLRDAETLGWGPMIAAASSESGDLANKMGNYEAARTDFEHAMFTAAEAGDDLLALEAAVSLVYTVGVGLGQHEDGLRLAKLAEVLLTRTDSERSLTEGRLSIQVGAIHSERGALDEALAAFENTLEIMQANLPPTHPNIAIALNNIGTILARQGQMERSLDYQERALALREAGLPAGHPRLASSYESIGSTYSFQGSYEKARAKLERALAICEANLPPGHLSIAHVLHNLGNNYYLEDDYDQARAHYERALHIYEAKPDERASVAKSLKHIGLALEGSNDHAAAADHFRRALLVDEALGVDGPKLADALNDLGRALRTSGNHDEAISTLERALRLSEAAEFPPLVMAETQWELAAALWDGAPRRRAEARTLMRASRQGYADQDRSDDVEETDNWLRERGAL